MGGAIYYQSNFDRNDYVCMKSNTFDTNTAHEGGGAIFLTRSKEVYFDGCIFKYNKVALSGGAIYSKDSDLYFQNYDAYQRDNSVYKITLQGKEVGSSRLNIAVDGLN